jgi:hypothetical protein
MRRVEALVALPLALWASVAFAASGSIGNAEGAPITFETGASKPLLVERVRITSSGLVGIATATPTVALEVSGTISGTQIQATSGQITSLGVGSLAASGNISAASLTVGGQSVTGGGGSGIGCVVSPSDLSNLVTLGNGGSCTFYSSSSVIQPATCASIAQTRTCSSGVLSGSYTAVSCTVVADNCYGSPSAGTVCADGSVYVGLSPDGNTKMFAPRCDAGQIWNGSSCTGSRSVISWNNGTSTWYDIPAISNCTDSGGTGGGYCTSYNTGRTYSAAIAAVTASGNSGPHQAAQYCENLTENGKSDWYLPSLPELHLLYVARNAANLTGTLDTSGNYYWSSTENALNSAWRERFNDAYQNDYSKNNAFYVRCVRK